LCFPETNDSLEYFKFLIVNVYTHLDGNYFLGASKTFGRCPRDIFLNERRSIDVGVVGAKPNTGKLPARKGFGL